MFAARVPESVSAPGCTPEAPLWALVADASLVDADGRADLAARLEPLATDAGWLLLVTCHRIEAYGWGEADAPELDGLPLLSGRGAARHLFRVAAGLESAVVGEDQILSQLRSAARSLLDDRRAGAELRRLAQIALGVGRGSRRSGHPGERGLADRALTRLRERGPVQRVLVAGSGPVGRATAFAARRRGLEAIVATRSPRRLPGDIEAIDLAAAAALAPSVDGIVVALAGRWEALASVDPAALPPIVDLSAPTAIPAAVRSRHRDLLLIDDLFPNPGDPAPIADADRTFARRAAQEVARAEARFAAWLAARPSSPTAQRLVERARGRRDARVERALRRLPELDEHGREVVRQLAAQLTADILHEPLAALGGDVDGSAAEAARDLFDL
jgi:glutamyl-tRNA reductase